MPGEIDCPVCARIHWRLQLAMRGQTVHIAMVAVRIHTYARTLCTVVVLLHALTASYAANEQKKLTDAVARARHARSFNEWAVEVTGGPESADSLARKHGLTNRGQIGNLRGFYLLTDGAEIIRTATRGLTEFAISKTAALEEDEMVTFVEQQSLRSRSKKTYFSPSDPDWSKQWSLDNTGQTNGPSGLDLNVQPVWMQAINGSGVVVAIVDDGLEWTHEDLINNYDPSASYDFVWYDDDPTPDEDVDEPNSHGTTCAGQVAMGRNCSCGVGVAYGSHVGGLKLDLSYSSDAVESEALGYNDSYIHIYSNSWGPNDYGFTVEGPGTLLQKTFSNGATEGRNGKGNIYVWASGNGGTYFDSCAADGFVNSIYTIAVGSANQNGQQADYDEDCSAKMAVTFSYNSDTFPAEDDAWTAYNQTCTTTLGGKCTDGFTGTSASAPLVSGVIALVLQANPDLTWRDVQYLIAYTSNPDILTGDDWVTNGAGLRVSHHFGFGAMDAEAMVTRARHWTNVPDQHKVKPPIRSQTRSVYNSDTMSIPVTERDVLFLEHVVVTLSLKLHAYGRGYDYSDFYDELYFTDDKDDVYDWLQSKHPRRGDIQIKLTSPSGTTSILLPYREYDFVNEEGYDNWPFMSVHFWGENPVGTWTLQTTFKSGSGHVAINDIDMTLYGTRDVPRSVSSIPSSCHSLCARRCFGEGPEKCDVCSRFRLLSNLTCIDGCPTGTHSFRRYCISDSDSGTVSASELSCKDIDRAETNYLSHILGYGVALGLITVVVTLVAALLYKSRKERNRFRRLQNNDAIVS